MKNINIKDYSKYVDEKIPKTNYFKNSFRAFIVGGLICTLGQGITNYFNSIGLNNEEVSTVTAIILVFLGAFFTGLGLYDKLGKFAGGGSIVPITGFANSIVSPAMEYKKEGYVLGVSAKMFSIAGPVLVYGYGSAVIYGLLYFLFTK
ncbi:stage V sporulation protein AC [Clostridium sp. D2Q-14]|uniref:stage V sporulation protein AC n=1 Tax=Anaeromonas gelatinilytica TaxID=2683194 RepID=UPI00193B15C0|nr:stage V sporulation protein AC [Anaeromonas gelatinilytica]MBS4534269.1 stage V sporulation protein AC [Anaeromonas gelatinilytica]